MIVVFRFVLTKLCWSAFYWRSSLSYENGACFKGILTTCWMKQVSIKFGHKSIPDEINLEFNVMKKRDKKCPAGVHPVAFWGWWKKNWIHDFRPQNQRWFEFNLWVKWSIHKLLEDFLFRRRFRDGSRNLITINNAQDARNVEIKTVHFASKRLMFCLLQDGFGRALGLEWHQPILHRMGGWGTLGHIRGT